MANTFAKFFLILFFGALMTLTSCKKPLTSEEKIMVKPKVLEEYEAKQATQKAQAKSGHHTKKTKHSKTGVK